ncbi:MAG: Maf family protein [Candidatus Kapabacteria bacterium]|nr:Maf family protein [Candidatus Kapabacteria bacterium]
MLNITQLLHIDKKIVLASASPRRKFLLEQIGLDFEIIPADIDEHNISAPEPRDIAKNLAAQKARAVASELDFPAYVIAADTIVVLDGKILNKPVDAADAKRMLQTLSGHTHTVYSGVTVLDVPGNRAIEDVQATKVTFRELNEAEIDAYVATGSPLDKAGAYGIQDDFGAVFVSHIEGCYYNIVGLPLEMLYTNLSRLVSNV